jgi:hypothetical protein
MRIMPAAQTWKIMRRISHVVKRVKNSRKRSRTVWVACK